MFFKKLYRRLKYWFQVRKYHIDNFRFDQIEDGGPIHFFVICNGEEIKITDKYGTMDGLQITDYGVFCILNRYFKNEK